MASTVSSPIRALLSLFGQVSSKTFTFNLLLSVYGQRRKTTRIVRDICEEILFENLKHPVNIVPTIVHQ
jgi:hypothetical protein